MKKIFTHLFVLFLLSLVSTSAWAQFTSGKVYRFVCSGTPSVSLGASAVSDVAALSTSETDRAQQWYVTGSNGQYTFRNLANGRYLLGHQNYSNDWRLTEESNEFTVGQVNGNYAIYQTSHGTYYTYMHKDDYNNIVSWESSAANSQWTPYEVSYTPAELQAIWNEVESFVLTEDAVKGYEEKLMAIFTDQACTQLNSTYASKSVSQIEADANYQALPATLQAMVLKVKNNDWSEANAVTSKLQWGSDYAKKFRVQMYEPYSIEGEITSYLRINAHCNMDNPTGLYANSGKAMYIMVEGEIKEGAELWVAYQTGLGATNYYNNASYTQLREGLNVVPYFYDTSSLWINYVVHTYNANGATIAEKFPHKLSDYKPLKIHIEGGHINGYYNAIGDFRAADSGTENLWGDVDNDDDWNYYMERAPLDGNDGRPNRDFPLLAHRQTLLFPLAPVVDDGGVTRAGLYHRIENIKVPSVPNCYGGSGKTFGTYADSYPGMGLSTSNGKINIMLEAWDRIMYSQLASMGVVSKSTMDKMNALYPRWTSAGTTAEIYDYNNKSSLDNKTYLEFCNGVDYSEYFNHHGCGVGWPNGYMSGGWRVTAYHYETMEGIIGTMASSSGSTWGPAHEIGHQHQSIINLEGQTEVTNNLFSNIAVWYMGMATSRYDGSQGSLESVLGAFTTEGSDLYTNNIWALTHLYYRLWLYYHLAGNNTQFWPRLFELCRQVPLENHTNGTNDGSTTLLRFYQHACDAAGEDLTEFFRAHGYLEVMDNRVVSDYYGATYNQTQEQIDAAIASVKAKNYPANYAVLLINDGTSETTFKHNGATRRGLWDGYATAEFGSVNDFISGDVDVTTNYSAQLSSDGTITMTGGEGGVGFLMFNDEGELVAFSNKPTFKLSQEAKELYQSKGESAIVVVNADNEIIRLGDEIVPDPEGQYTVSVQAEPAEGGTATVNDKESVTVDAGSTVTLTATPYSGDYKFDGWYLNDVQVSTSSTYTPTVTGNVTYVAKFCKDGAVEPEPEQPAQESGYYYLVNRATNRHEYLYNDALNKDNSLCFTLQSDAAVSTNNGVWYITFNDNNTLGIKNGDGKPVVAGASWAASILGTYTELAIQKTTEVDGYTYYSFTNGLNCSDSGQGYFKIEGTNFVTTWQGFPDEADNQWRLESIDMQGKSVYDVEINSSDVYVTYNSEYAYDGGFFITDGAIDESKLVVQGNASATAVVEGNVIRVVEEPENPSGLDKTALQELIADMQSLLGKVADKTTAKTALALQTTDEDDRFYIWSNATAWDCDGIGALIDKNDDGTAKTGTFFGTTWDGGAVNSYDHYIAVDLGVDVAISELSIDYTTRDSDHSNQRPTAIKVLGSNDKEGEYAEITTLSEGMPVGRNQKWEMTSTVALDNYYRYIRFAPATEVGYFNMSDFNLYSHCIATVKEYYSTSDIFDCLPAAMRAYCDAKEALSTNLSSEDYAAVKDALAEQVEVLKAIVDADVTDKSELETLIAATDALIGEMASGVNVTEELLPLQCTDVNEPYYIYCNAPGATNNYKGDNLGVAALLDVDDNGEPITATFLHTSYVAGSHDDDLDHYIRVDMGESNLLSFKFRYTPRIGNTSNAPLVMLIEGSNDCVNFEEITTLTDMTPIYQSGEITNGKTYRYIRFMVKKTHNNDSHNGHEFFAMSHFEMTACKRLVVAEGVESYLLLESIVEAYVEKQQAETLLEDYYTSENKYKTVLEELQTAYDVLVAKKTNLLKELKELIDATTLLKNSLYEIAVTSYTATDVALQNTDEAAAGYLYCNAPETNSPWDSDNKGVYGCIDLTEKGDPDLSTFLHTEYGNDPSADGLDHYLRVDLGAEGATAYIEFGYVGRSGHETKSPETAIVEATNDLNGEWTTIKTLNLAQPSATAETKTGALGNGVAYRYWRFMVTDTYFDGYDGQGNHKFFALSDFNVYKCTDVVLNTQLKSEYNPNIYIYTTAELVAGVEAAIASATEVYEKNPSASFAECNVARLALLPEYEKLAEAIKYYWTPVKLTINEYTPFLYTINAIGRGDDKAWQYNAQNNNITVVKNDATNLYHLWYFVQGTKEHTVKIVPVMTPGYRLDATEFGNAADKVSAVAESSVDWSFDYNSEKWNFKPYGKNTYLSNFNGGSYPLGFYNYADGGSHVSFTAVEVENYALARLTKFTENKSAVVAGETVGSYVTGEDYNAAFETAKKMLDNTSATDEECATTFADLFEAYRDLELVLPESGTFYTITNVGREGGKMYAGDETEPVLWWDNNDVTAKYIFTFEPTGDKGKYYLKSLERGTYLSTALSHNGGIEKIAADKEYAKVVTVNNMSMYSRAVSITPEGGAMLHADNSGNANKVVAWNNNEANNASAWLIDEVTDLSQITHEVKMNATFSSVMLGYNATVPAGVEVYNAEGVEGGYVSLVKLAGKGEVIPANTPVILYRTDGETSKTFTYTTDSATSVPTETVLGGSLYQKYVKCEKNMDYYKLMIKGGEAKMYWMYKEFDENGTYGEDDALKGTNEGGHIKCSANKIYMALPSQHQAASYGMRFVTPGATDIDEVNGEDCMVKTIYDLQGRKLDEITEPGFYIVNGKKILVK